MEQQQMDEFQAQVELLNAHGINPEKWLEMIDNIINGSLTDLNYKRSGKPLAKAKDKQKEINRIVSNYGAALKTITKDDSGEKLTIKFTAIAAAAKAGLSALGMDNDQINKELGLYMALRAIKGGK